MYLYIYVVKPTINHPYYNIVRFMIGFTTWCYEYHVQNHFNTCIDVVLPVVHQWILKCFVNHQGTHGGSSPLPVENLRGVQIISMMQQKRAWVNFTYGRTTPEIALKMSEHSTGTWWNIVNPGDVYRVYRCSSFHHELSGASSQRGGFASPLRVHWGGISAAQWHGMVTEDGP